jgi:hypothetical protein
MSSTQAQSRDGGSVGPVPRRFVPLVAIALALGILFLALGYLSNDEGESGDARGFVIVVVVTLAVTYAVWEFLVSRRFAGTSSAAGPAIGIGIAAVITGFLYWTGLGYGLAPAAIALGTIGRERGEGQNATIGLVLGWVGLLAAVVVGLADNL